MTSSRSGRKNSNGQRGKLPNPTCSAFPNQKGIMKRKICCRITAIGLGSQRVAVTNELVGKTAGSPVRIQRRRQIKRAAVFLLGRTVLRESARDLEIPGGSEVTST